MKLLTTNCGWAGTRAMPRTAYPRTTATSSPQWTGTTTRLQSVALVHQPMEEDGGSTGPKFFLELPNVILLSCFESNLNGEYFLVGEDNGYYRGIVWELWLGDYSLKSALMMVRPKELPPPAPSLPTVPAPDP